ncbi:MAG: LuxR C-terminal-related transcriptional regulator [Treponema sp.]|nr:LuxR C-terminal-related transcriptional regulator [Treponema sp.]
MAIKNIIGNDTTNFQQDGEYLERPRLHTLLKNVINYPLIIVCAGSGYGKTHTVRSFLENYNAQTAWLQISERDNITARFWESISGMTSIISKEAGERLMEIGFPKTNEAFANFNTIINKITSSPGKHIMVIDDFHLIQNLAVLNVIEQMIRTIPLNMTIIIITRTMPDINMFGKLMHEHVFTIHEDALRFREDEIGKYFSQINLPVTSGEIHNIFDDTQGWAFAVNLIARSLAKKKKYERYALEAMKKNIFRFIEAEISQTITGMRETPPSLLIESPLWRFLLRISLIDHLSASIINSLAKNDELIKKMELLNAYLRYDFNQDTYMIHHLFRDYLRQKQEQEQILTEEEKKETYETAAVWCEAYGYHTDTLSYYEKSGNFDAIIRKVVLLNLQIPYDTALFALEIFDRMPDNVKSNNILFPSMYVKLKFNLGQFDEAQKIAEQYIADYEARQETPERNRALTSIYGSLGLLRMSMSTYNDIYDFDLYFKKMAEYFDKNPFKTIGTYKLTSMTSRASLVGTNRPGAMEEYIEAVTRAVPYLSHVFNGFHDGFEDLVLGELCFNRMEFSEAEQYFIQSIDKARKSDQYVTQNRAMVYMINIDISRADIEAATAKLKEMETHLSEKDYGVRYTMFDIANSFYHLTLGQPEQIPEWLKGDFTPYTHPSFLENYANRVRTRYHYQTRHYSTLLAFIENAMEHPAILFDKVELKIMQALSLYQFKRYKEAISVFEEAYHLSESNKLIALFVQFAKDMRTLCSAALKQSPSCSIPKNWLEDIHHKSSSLAKRKAKMISDYRLANNLEKGIRLTEREILILKDLADGLSRTEIASSRKLSVNTVKMTVNIIYDKLGVLSLPEAIRAAVDRKII